MIQDTTALAVAENKSMWSKVTQIMTPEFPDGIGKSL